MRKEQQKIARELLIVAARLSELDRQQHLIRESNPDAFENRKTQLERKLDELRDRLEETMYGSSATVTVTVPRRFLRRSPNNKEIVIVEDAFKNGSALEQLLKGDFEDQDRSRRSDKRDVAHIIASAFDEGEDYYFDRGSEVEDIQQFLIREHNGYLVTKERR